MNNNVIYLNGRHGPTIVDETEYLSHLLSNVDIQIANLEMYTSGHQNISIKTLKDLVANLKVRVDRVNEMAKGNNLEENDERIVVL